MISLDKASNYRIFIIRLLVILIGIGPISSVEATQNGISFSAHDEEHISGNARLEVNPKPEHFLEISGNKPAGMEIWFGIDYAARAEGCRVMGLGQMLAGSPPVAPQAYDRIRVAPAEIDFSVKLPLDKYLPGKCDWVASYVSESTFEPALAPGPPGWESLYFFTDTGESVISADRKCKRHLIEGQNLNVIWCRSVDSMFHLRRSGATLSEKYDLEDSR